MFHSLKVVFALVNSADTDEMPHNAAFYLGLRCLPKYPLRGFWSSKGKRVAFPFLQDLPVYSSEEKALMAEILRGDQLKERSEKARNVDMKLHDAKRRRMFRAAQAAAMGNRR